MIHDAIFGDNLHDGDITTYIVIEPHRSELLGSKY
jgi:hypothetical protein